MAEHMTAVPVESLIGGPLEWATTNTPAPNGMSPWQFLIDNLYAKRGYAATTTLGLIMGNNIELVPDDPFAADSGWFATCLTPDGARCRYHSKNMPVAVRRAFVGAAHGDTIEIPTRVLEFYK